ncbi:hypothetical protein [Streptomyces lushanensis]|uniref:hypothetical protein n=1 Tax=Streptomyces lushanensis TaxID=1434255 RepID=UPI00083006E2|nr:hypothetical protein [Streptomyces lushanensis]
MNTTVAGLVTGLALGFAGYFGGFGAFLVVAVLGLVGLIAGYLARGDVRVSDYIPTRNGEGRQATFRNGGGRRETLGHRGSTYGTAPHSEYRTRVR